MISMTNSITPMIVRVLVSYETHRNEGSVQRSLFMKTCLFRWIQTAILLSIITPFTSTISEGGLINILFSIFFTGMIYTPLTNLSDIFGHYNRHFLAPRAPDQRRMNLLFTGTQYDLAERYTVSGSFEFQFL